MGLICKCLSNASAAGVQHCCINVHGVVTPVHVPKLCCECTSWHFKSSHWSI